MELNLLRKKHLFLTLGIAQALLLVTGSAQAQTTLALGDIAFTGANSQPSSGSDEICFVILKSTGITSGTTIRFTDKGWISGSCGSNGWADNLASLGGSANCTTESSDLLWTAGSSLSYGTHV